MTSICTSTYSTILKPETGWQPVNFRELWRYRELLYFLVWRDVKVRYKQTVLGAAWAIIQPLMTMVVFSIFFGRFGGMAQHVEGSYAVFVYAALLPWTYFATAISQSGSSLVSGGNLVSKVYFPRLIMPLSAGIGGLVDFAVAFTVLLGLMLFHGIPLSAPILALPLFLGLAVLTATGIGSLLAALVIVYRDFRYILSFMVQLWMFASPVAYPLDVIPEQWRLLYALNPMVGVISGFRWSIVGDSMAWDCFAVSVASGVILFLVGVSYFRRMERRFADII